MTNQSDHIVDTITPDPLSPKILLQQLKETLAYLRSKWLVLIVAGIITGSAGAIYMAQKKTLFKAEITFAIDEGQAQKGNSEFSEFSEQLGLGSVDGGTIFSSSKNIEELLKSRLIIEKTLRSTIEIDGKKLLLADFFLDSLNYRSKWITNGPYPEIDFHKIKTNKDEILFENNIIRNIYKVIISKNIQISEKSKGSSITLVTCLSEHQLFSKYFLEKLISEVTQYYIDSKTRRSKINLSIIEKRNDSVKNAYVSSVYGRASMNDADINLVRQTPSVPSEKKQTDVQILRSAYIDLSRSIESAKTSLMNVTPLIEIIDTPILPLDVIKPSVMKNFFLFFLVGSFLGIVYLISSRVYRHLTE